jgi:hypothetical protein
VQYGSKNKLGDAVEMLEWLKKQVIIKTSCPPHMATFDFKQGVIVCGEFVEEQKQGFSKRLEEVRQKVQAKKRKS